MNKGRKEKKEVEDSPACQALYTTGSDIVKSITDAFLKHPYAFIGPVTMAILIIYLPNIITRTATWIRDLRIAAAWLRRNWLQNIEDLENVTAL